MNGIKSCKRCLFDDTVKNITFDEEGICNFCRVLEKMRNKYKKADIEKLFSRIKRRMKHKTYDCIVPLSGGIDSTYVLYYVKKAGLRPIAVHTDNGWVAEIAKQNMKKAVEKLDVPFVRLTKDWELLKDIYLAFLKASVPRLCTVCEVKSISELMEFAVNKNIPYLIFGFSPETDGLAPIHWHYIDSRYYDSIVNRFSQKKEDAKRLNKAHFRDIFFFSVKKGIRHIQLPRFMEWDESEIKKILKNELHWIDGGHHSDCDYYSFMKYVVKKKFNIDKHKTFLSAQINSGKLTREEALRIFKESSLHDIESKIENVLARLGISRKEFQEILEKKPRYFTDYPTYYPIIKKLKPLCWLGCRTRFFTHGLYEYMFETGV